MNFFKLVLPILYVAIVVLMTSVAQAGQVKLGWDRPNKASAEYARIKVYWGKKSGQYPNSKKVNKNATSVTITGLKPGKTYFFAATTITKSGEESAYSNEVKYKLTAAANVDTDGDGITDQDERDVYGTDPNQADSDGDGIEDGDEIALWGDRWSEDADGDGLINLLDRDADNDGMTDAAEVDANYDPGDANSAPDNRPADLIPLPIESVLASKDKKRNRATHTIDSDLDTFWSAKGDGQWVMYDIGTTALVAEIAIAWVRGDRRKASFSIETSVDGTVWQEAFSGDSSGRTDGLESYRFKVLPARYVRVVGYGNSANRRNEIAELEIYGQLEHMPLPMQSVRASRAEAPNQPANTVDGDLNTYWAAEGDGQWLTYDTGALSMIGEVAIAWLKGDSRIASFTIEVSNDGNTWREVFSGDSSGTTRDLETYTFPAVVARHVLIAVYGNSADLWNEIAETEIRGYVIDEKTIERKKIGKKTYTVQLVAQDNFDTLDNWVLDMPDPAAVTINDNILEWDALNTVGTLWYRTKIAGSSMMEFEVQVLDGNRNVNAIAYGSIKQNGKETLLEARRDGNGIYKEYSKFQNYTMTLIDPDRDNVWRARFRKNPGAKIIAQRYKKHKIRKRKYQRMTYVFEANGKMSVYINGKRMHQYKDKKGAYRDGHHALRISRTHSKYRNFKIYRMLPNHQR